MCAIYQHHSAAPFRVHTDIGSLVTVEQPSLRGKVCVCVCVRERERGGGGDGGC